MPCIKMEDPEPVCTGPGSVRSVSANAEVHSDFEADTKIYEFWLSPHGSSPSSKSFNNLAKSYATAKTNRS